MRGRERKGWALRTDASRAWHTETENVIMKVSGRGRCLCECVTVKRGRVSERESARESFSSLEYLIVQSARAAASSSWLWLSPVSLGHLRLSWASERPVGKHASPFLYTIIYMSVSLFFIIIFLMIFFDADYARAVRQSGFWVLF